MPRKKSTKPSKTKVLKARLTEAEWVKLLDLLSDNAENSETVHPFADIYQRLGAQVLSPEDFADWEEFGLNLFECMKLRNVTCVPHRTLHEFDWFIDQCIFHDLDPDEDFDVKKYSNIYYRELKSMTPCPMAHELIAWSRAFLQYCKDEYKEGDYP